MPQLHFQSEARDDAQMRLCMKELKRDLLTSKYTRVMVEEEYTFNAPNRFSIETKDGEQLCEIKFQEGPIRECGVKGIHNEDLLNIVLERLGGFQ